MLTFSLSQSKYHASLYIINRTLLYLCVLFHILASIWILIGKTEGGWITKLEEDDAHSEAFVYVTALYFVVTTASTVGYGDFFAYNPREKLFMIFLEITAICTFSIITGNITSLKRIVNISEIIETKVKYKIM